MITDLLAVVAFIDRHEGVDDHDAAMETAIEYVDRDVEPSERQELQDTLNDGWLDR